MLRKHFSLLAIVLASALAFAVPVTSNDVSYKSGDETVHAVQYSPEGKGRFPAIIVIHEWWGLNDWVKEQAQKLAEQGYITLAIDLYRGKVATTSDEAHELINALPDDRRLRDLKAAFSYLQSQKNVDAKRIGSIGWCAGGGWSLELAENEPGLKAAVINYGELSSDTATLKPIHAAILGSFGGQDRGITADDVHKFEQQMKALGKKVEVKIYPDAGHAFENRNRPTYRADDAQDAWQRTVDFLEDDLKK
ncbi:MAG TPA: dienelactone hydrolase family protein [Terriglobales bacterium]|nr:dienelactone hydrolase family protein [Terriglobales bacterium]